MARRSLDIMTSLKLVVACAAMAARSTDADRRGAVPGLGFRFGGSGSAATTNALRVGDAMVFRWAVAADSRASNRWLAAGTATPAAFCGAEERVGDPPLTPFGDSRVVALGVQRNCCAYGDRRSA